MGDPTCTTFIGAALIPVANGVLSRRLVTAEDCSCVASLTSRLLRPARLPRSVPAHFRLPTADKKSQKQKSASSRAPMVP